MFSDGPNDIQFGGFRRRVCRRVGELEKDAAIACLWDDVCQPEAMRCLRRDELADGILDQALLREDTDVLRSPSIQPRKQRRRVAKDAV